MRAARHHPKCQLLSKACDIPTTLRSALSYISMPLLSREPYSVAALRFRNLSLNVQGSLMTWWGATCADERYHLHKMGNHGRRMEDSQRLHLTVS